MATRFQKYSIIIVFILVIIIVLSILKVPYKIDSMAKVLPARQWILTRGANGDIFTFTSNNLDGNSNTFKLTSFERGESMILDLTSHFNIDKVVQEGDTLGIIYSSKKEEKLVQLNGELEVLCATLAASMSGEKKTEIEEAEKRIEMAVSEYDKQSRIVTRLKKLLDKELIAEEEYLTAVDELSVLDKAVKIRNAELESCLSGKKVGEIDMLKKKINAVKSNISFLKKEIYSQSAILAPFSGRLERSFSNDTLIVLSNFDIGVALIPVPVEDAKYLDEGDKVTFNETNSPGLLIGVIQMKQPTMKIINGRQCIVVVATVYDLSKDFISGVITKAEIDCGKLSVIDYTGRAILN